MDGSLFLRPPTPCVLLSRGSSCLSNPGKFHIADLHLELSQELGAVGFWVPPLLILLEAEASRTGQMQTGEG